MTSHTCKHWALTLSTVVGIGLAGCGGSSDLAEPATAPMPGSPGANPPARVTLKAPVLSFTDTGLSVSDGVTFNGLWSVTNDGLGWEYSLDQGRTWTRGAGGFFEVRGDGPKMIWVRSVDDAGNTSEIVMVTCVLDTRPPDAVAVTPSGSGTTRTLQINGLETGAHWEYSLDGQQSWRRGAGNSLGVLGNGLGAVALRQVDIAGNVSMPQTIRLDDPASDSWHEASGNAMQPSTLSTSGSRVFVVHGSVIRGDADFIRWDVPSGHRLTSVQLVHYASEDKIAFYALQRAAVFDAGVDVNRMMVYGHMGPSDLGHNVVSGVALDQLGAGPMTLWFQQTGPLPTTYALEIQLQPMP